MDFETIDELRLLIEFARHVNYNDSRFYPKDINAAADKVEAYLDGDADGNALHEPMWCSRKGCEQEATRWYLDDLKNDNSTVYVCLDHKDVAAAEESGRAEILNAKGEMVELAVYECKPDCEGCNS